MNVTGIPIQVRRQFNSFEYCFYSSCYFFVTAIKLSFFIELFTDVYISLKKLKYLTVCFRATQHNRGT